MFQSHNEAFCYGILLHIFPQKYSYVWRERASIDAWYYRQFHASRRNNTSRCVLRSHTLNIPNKKKLHLPFESLVSLTLTNVSLVSRHKTIWKVFTVLTLFFVVAPVFVEFFVKGKQEKQLKTFSLCWFRDCFKLLYIFLLLLKKITFFVWSWKFYFCLWVIMSSTMLFAVIVISGFVTSTIALKCYQCGMYNDGVGSITPCMNHTHQELKSCAAKDNMWCIVSKTFRYVFQI